MSVNDGSSCSMLWLEPWPHHFNYLADGDTVSDLVNELRQHALMYANEIRKSNAEKCAVHQAYGRIKTLIGNNCPICWLKSEKASALEVTAHAREVDIYKCRECGFSGAFSKMTSTD